MNIVIYALIHFLKKYAQDIEWELHKGAVGELD